MSTSTVTLKSKPHSCGEQVRGLRALVARRNAQTEQTDSTIRNCHTIVISGGKGGTGLSVIALNLALSFAQQGESVGLLDAAAGFGNIELLCGLNGYWNLSHVAQGCRELRDVVLTGPARAKLLSGANCLVDPSMAHHFRSDRLTEQLQRFERGLDWLIVDASGGALITNRDFVTSADDLLIVTTPESTSIAEAYSSIKSLTSACRPRIGLLVNQAESATQANQILDRLQQAARSFLQVDLHRRGFLPRDPVIPISVSERVPFVIQSPDSPAAIELSKLAQRWTRTKTLPGQSSSFFARIFERED